MRLLVIILTILSLTSCGILKNKDNIIIDTESSDTLQVNDIQIDTISNLFEIRDDVSYSLMMVENRSINVSSGEQVEKEPLQIIEESNSEVPPTTSITDGHVAYKIPTEMSVRSTYQIIVRISKSTLNIYENIDGDVKSSSIPISETMEVKVIDPSPSDNKMFEIIPNNTPIQLVENNDEVTQWTFDVTPLRAGTSKLKVVISIIRNGLVREIVYEDSVTVKADITKTIPFFIATYWQWLITTLIIPIVIWLYKRKKDKKKRTNTEEEE